MTSKTEADYIAEGINPETARGMVQADAQLDRLMELTLGLELRMNLLMARQQELQEVARLALEHVLELEDAWAHGNIVGGGDGLSGWRASRNASVRAALQKALA